MHIILAEEGAAAQTVERPFDKPVILFGRDASECDLVFDNTAFPMVSRRHAELRWQDGKWYIVDLKSSYGTFHNGQRLTVPQQVEAGSLLQFGTDGPRVRVVWFEVEFESISNLATSVSIPAPVAAPLRPLATPASSPRQSDVPTAVMPPPRPSPVAVPAQLDFVQARDRQPYRITKPTTWLGRDPACDVIFEETAGMVSRRHAEIRLEGRDYRLADNKSFNGTLVNGQRITTPVPVYHDDEIQLGVGGPVLKFNSPALADPFGSSLAGQRSVSTAMPAEIGSKTVIFDVKRGPAGARNADVGDAQLLFSVAFDGRGQLTIGRDTSNDIALEGLQISKRHARLTQGSSGAVVEDLNSTNGVYVNAARVTRQAIGPDDAVQIGSFLLRVDRSGQVGVFDTRSKHRIDVAGVSKEVKNRGGAGRISLLDNVSLSIEPNEFVGILGPSGAGKSTLINVLNGVRPATSGNVLINGQDLYRHFDSLKQAIGYVPQDDIIHRELSVYRTLYYVARLRLSRDVSRTEIDQIINEVLDVTGLTERRDMPVKRLSGGQRKRVSIAVELITKPSVIFLDEPTSGLDPATEEKIMRLFRQIAESGRTVVMTTHAMENVRLFDKVILLMAGKLVFYGKPDDALKHFQAADFRELFDHLEGAADTRSRSIATADGLRQRFQQTPEYRELIQKPLSELGQLQTAKQLKRRRLGIFGSLGQWMILSRRYFELLLKDKMNLFILVAQAPAIALLTFFAMGANKPRDFVYFVLALVAVWFGTSVAAREMIRERPVYRRERMFNLGILPYVASKLFVLGIIVVLQCVLLFLPLKLFDLAGLMAMPGEYGGLPQFTIMLMTAGVGVALGLLVSSLVRTSEMATSLVPLLLIPQLLFAGLNGAPAGVNKVASLAMPAAWSFDTMKRFSMLDTLEPEGADPRGKTKGLGLYKFIETENEKTVNKAKRDLEDLKRIAGQQYREGDSSDPSTELPSLGAIQKIPQDLSQYITFLHPWMDEVLNQVVLMLMFGLLVISTLIILKLQDIV